GISVSGLQVVSWVKSGFGKRIPESNIALAAKSVRRMATSRQVEHRRRSELGLILSGFYARAKAKGSFKMTARWLRPDLAGYRLGCNPAVRLALLVFEMGTEHVPWGCLSPKPARKRVDSRSLVRTPSMTGGMDGCVAPRMTKIISAASPGESTLAVMPTPWTLSIFISSSPCFSCTTLARATSASERE